MNRYYSTNRDEYFEEPQTDVISENISSAKRIVDDFNVKISDERYIVKKPTARILGHVEKQD